MLNTWKSSVLAITFNTIQRLAICHIYEEIRLCKGHKGDVLVDIKLLS